MIQVTGRTYDHRDTLRVLGGVWDNASKGWIIRRKISDHDLKRLRNLVGVIVTDLDNDRSDVRLPATSGQSKIYGDDPTYFNHFACQNPKAFFGFSSLVKFVDYVASLPRHYAIDPDRAGWEHGGAVWNGTDTMGEALEIARDGWQEGATAAERIIDRLALANPRTRQHRSSMAGGIVNVGRMLSGDPRHMILRPKQPGRKIVTLFVEAGCMGTINSGTLIRRAAIVGAICDIMENSGYSCTIVTTDMSIGVRNENVYQIAVTLKESGERLNLSDLMFALGHPAFLRRMSFATLASVPETRSLWLLQGSPSNAFTDDHPCGRNEFYVPMIEKNTSTIDETLPLVIPKNLPITLDSDR